MPRGSSPSVISETEPSELASSKITLVFCEGLEASGVFPISELSPESVLFSSSEAAGMAFTRVFADGSWREISCSVAGEVSRMVRVLRGFLIVGDAGDVVSSAEASAGTEVASCSSVERTRF